MKKASEYRQHAKHCLALARGMRRADQRDQLLRMATTWLALADERERMLRAGREWLGGGTPNNGSQVPSANVIQNSKDEISRSRRIIREIKKRDEAREREK